MAANWGVSRSSHLEFGGRQPLWLALLSPPTTLGGPGQLLPMEVCRAASSSSSPTPLPALHTEVLPCAVLGPSPL